MAVFRAMVSEANIFAHGKLRHLLDIKHGRHRDFVTGKNNRLKRTFDFSFDFYFVIIKKRFIVSWVHATTGGMKICAITVARSVICLW